MLSKAAFNALLKTLEEPPEHAVFILATTDAHKLPATIISRTQRFVFRFISKEDVCKHLEFIAKNEKIKISKEAIEIIAERGEGSFRDSISLLDQISSISKDGEEITAKLLEETLGLASKTQINALISAFESQNANEVLEIVRGIRDSGVDLKNFASQLLNFITENVGVKPYLSQLLVPLTRAEKSNFIEMELLSIFIRPDFVPQITPVKQQILSSPKPVQAQKTTTQPKAKNETFKNPPNEKMKHEEPPKEKEVETPKTKTPQKEVEATEILLENEDLGEAREFKWGDFCNAVNEEDKGIQTILKQSGYAFENGKIKI